MFQDDRQESQEPPSFPSEEWHEELNSSTADYYTPGIFAEYREQALRHGVALSVLCKSYQQEEGCGDVFHFQSLNSDTCVLYIADVAGHGDRAQAVAGYVRELLWTDECRALASDSLVDVVLWLDQVLFSIEIPDVSQSQKAMSLTAFKVSSAQQKLAVLDAGHGPSHLISANRIPQLMNKRGSNTIIGHNFYRDEDYEVVPEAHHDFLFGSTILSMTDGLTESYEKNSDRQQLVSQMVESHCALEIEPEKLVSSIFHSLQRPEYDDCLAMAFQLVAPPTKRVFPVSF